MKFPESERVGTATASDGSVYVLDFYGEDEGAAVVTGPSQVGAGMVEMPEIHREDASSADDARAKLTAWSRAKGWRVELLRSRPPASG